MSTWFTERENIRIEELCDAITLALEEAEREEVSFDAGEAGGVSVLEDVRGRARAAGYVAAISGGVLTVRKKPPT